MIFVDGSGFAKQSGGRARNDLEVDYGTTIGVYPPRTTIEPLPASDVKAVDSNDTSPLFDDEATIRMLVAKVTSDFGGQSIEGASACDPRAISRPHRRGWPSMAIYGTLPSQFV
jgi:hypothetical protein